MPPGVEAGRRVYRRPEGFLGVLPLTAAPPESRGGSGVPLLGVSQVRSSASGYLLPNENRVKVLLTNGTLNALEYLTNILASKVYDVAYESPLQLATKLSQKWGVNVTGSERDLQPLKIFGLLFRFSAKSGTVYQIYEDASS
ncbi:hypothetical protein DH2020_040008 [Rehmannia glutinosa]|uniref:Uncharacterized protein n=1 Tax=Rehmannia glutinosa TaxID=99300 RepID=A0ABR0UU86_REHGL